MATIRLAVHAMATRFELVLEGDEEVYLRAAGEEALREISRLEEQLSFYRSASEVSRLNARASVEPVLVTPALFDLLDRARRAYEETGGAFDITVAPLMRCWGFTSGSGSMPEPEAVAAARERVGMQFVRLDRGSRTVFFERQGMMIDLGGIGKGYAIEQAAEVLREAGITSALLHGGTSTMCAIGGPAREAEWKVALRYPGVEGGEDEEGSVIATVALRDQSMSVSAVWGKSFTYDGRVYGHVLDPRIGTPVEGAVLAACIQEHATETDALSTALLIMGAASENWLRREHPQVPALILMRAEDDGRYHAIHRGFSVVRRENVNFRKL